MVGSVLDGRQSSDDSLIVGDLGIGFFVQWDVEVDLDILSMLGSSQPRTSRGNAYTDEDALVLDVDVGDGEFAAERHLGICEVGE